MTANATKEDRQACLTVGMDDYISKPIRVEELVGALRKCRPLKKMQGRETAERGGAREQRSQIAEEKEHVAEEAKVDGVLDPAALENLQEMMGGDVEFLAELIDTFLKDAPQILTDMRQAVEQGDTAGLRLAAHSLKSNSADFGMMALSNLCRELEGMGKAGTLDGAAELVAQAAVEYEQVKAALETVRSG
jgi:HPt (histidine-containing phosphotransfer) domain-containing protein